MRSALAEIDALELPKEPADVDVDAVLTTLGRVAHLLRVAVAAEERDGTP